MKTTLADESLHKIINSLKSANTKFSQQYSGALIARQPIHTIYGGAHLFTAETPAKLGTIARRMLENYASDAATLATIFGLSTELAAQIFPKLQEKLNHEPIEDLRVDFEDGYGYRADAEEDQHAAQAATQTATAIKQNLLPPFFGIRIKSLSNETHQRAIRTLDIFLTQLLEQTQGALPENFVITLPKIVMAEQVTALAEIFQALESQLGIAPKSLRLELMIETPQAICNDAGVNPISRLIQAANGRCKAIHFGAFDYTASCGIAGEYQNIRHPACDFARQMMLAATAGTDVWLADGVTTQLPLEPHRGAELTSDQVAANHLAIASAWKIHYENIRHSLACGFYQSWDLHPAQLIPRYVATYAFYLESLSMSATRLRNFIAKAAQATAVGTTFDDAASAQGLLNYFLRAVNCGVIPATQIETLCGISFTDMQLNSFAKINLSGR